MSAALLVSAERAGFVQALAAEWTKLRSVRSTAWSLLGLVGGTLLLTVVFCASASTDGCTPGASGCDDDTVLLSLSGVYIGQIAVIVLAVMVITSEYRTGTIRATFVANPRRRTVLTAKIAVVAATVFGASLVTAVMSFLVGQAILAGNGYTAANGYPLASLGDGPALRAVVGAALYLTVLALLSLGLGAVLRHTAGATTAMLALLFVPTFAASVFLPDTVAKLTPVAGLAILQAVDSPNGLPIGPWAGLGVLCVYAGVALVAGFWLIEKRDA